MRFYFVCTILILCISHAYTKYDYKSTFQNADIYNACDDQPSNVLDINGMIDFTNFHSDFADNGELVVSGNFTTKWDIQPSDRIKANLKIFRFDRGSWAPTQYSLVTPSFCQIMYVKNDFWYEAFIKHVMNADQIKSKCLNTPGTTFIMETYAVNIPFSAQESDLTGYYKVQVKMEAIDITNKVRPTAICFEIKGDLEVV